MTHFRLFLIVWMLCWAALRLQAQEFPERPTGFVSDYAGVLKPQERLQLETYLRNFRDSTSNEIAVVFFPDLQGYDIETFSGTLARKWGIGGKENNGVLLIFFMKERKMRIEVGYGLEGVIPDALTAQIRNQYLLPAFRSGKYFDGVFKAVQFIARQANQEFHDQAQSKGKKKKRNDLLLSMFIVGLIVLVLYWFARRRGGGGGSGGHGGGFFFVGPTYGGYGGGYSGGSSGGSDFGGFGGGDFGGGGSSGDW